MQERGRESEREREREKRRRKEEKNSLGGFLAVKQRLPREQVEDCTFVISESERFCVLQLAAEEVTAEREEVHGRRRASALTVSLTG